MNATVEPGRSTDHVLAFPVERSLSTPGDADQRLSSFLDGFNKGHCFFLPKQKIRHLIDFVVENPALAVPVLLATMQDDLPDRDGSSCSTGDSLRVDLSYLRRALGLQREELQSRRDQLRAIFHGNSRHVERSPTEDKPATSGRHPSPFDHRDPLDAAQVVSTCAVFLAAAQRRSCPHELRDILDTELFGFCSSLQREGQCRVAEIVLAQASDCDAQLGNWLRKTLGDIDHTTPDIRAACAGILGHVTLNPGDVISSLLASLRSESDETDVVVIEFLDEASCPSALVRPSVIRALGSLVSDAPNLQKQEVVQTLLSVIKECDGFFECSRPKLDTATRAAEVLRMMMDADSLAPFLLKVLPRAAAIGHDHFLSEATEILGNVNVSFDQVIPALFSLLDDNNPNVSGVCLLTITESLGSLARRSRGIIPRLGQLVRGCAASIDRTICFDDNIVVRLSSSCLKRSDGIQAAFRPVHEALRKEMIVSSGAQALKDLGTDAKAVVRDLYTALTHLSGSSWTRGAVAEALLQLDGSHDAQTVSLKVALTAYRADPRKTNSDILELCRRNPRFWELLVAEAWRRLRNRPVCSIEVLLDTALGFLYERICRPSFRLRPEKHRGFVRLLQLVRQQILEDAFDFLDGDRLPNIDPEEIDLPDRAVPSTCDLALFLDKKLSPFQKQIVDLRLKGYEWVEIAAEVGLTKWKVYNVMTAIRELIVTEFDGNL